MGAACEHDADWQDAAAYAPLLGLGRSGFAWEWLRRNEHYRASAALALARRKSLRNEQVRPADADALPWGLHAFEPPDRNALTARPMWHRGVYPHVLVADAAGKGAGEDCLDIGRFGALVSLVAQSGGPEHLLLSNGLRALRVDIEFGSVRSGPVVLRYRLEGFERVRQPLEVLRQLLSFNRAGILSPARHPVERRARRWVQLLRTHDALMTGASQREIAQFLLGLNSGERRWRVGASSIRSRAQRLVRDARHMAAGGYRTLLGAPGPGAR